VTGSVQGLGLVNGRRLRVFGVTATKAGPSLPAGTLDIVACYFNFNIVAPNYLFTVINGSFSNNTADGTIHHAEIQYVQQRNSICDSRGQPFTDTFSATDFTPPSHTPPGFVPFFATHSFGPFQDQVVSLSEDLHMVVNISGDTVNITTTSADVEASTTPPPITPALPPAGLFVMVILLLGGGAWLLRTRSSLA